MADRYNHYTIGRGGGARDLVDRAADKVDDAGEAVADTAKSAGRKIGNAAEAAEHKVERAATSARDAVANHTPRPGQALVGAAIGGAAGYMDSMYIEPFGAYIGGGLLALQVLDHEGFVSLPWNSADSLQTHSGHHPIRQGRTVGVVRATSAVGSEAANFVGNNVYLALGFVGGYFIIKSMAEQQ